MGYPTIDEARIYKSRTIRSQAKVAVELDYPVWDQAFTDDFDGATLDSDLWEQNCPSWGQISVAGGTVTLSVPDAVTGGIAPPWIQSKFNKAFPLDTRLPWQFDIRCRFPVATGFGVFIRICGTSYRDAEAIWGLKCNSTTGLGLNCPDGFTADDLIWNTAGGGDSWRRYRVVYDPKAQTYTCSIDQDDDGVYETVVVVPVAGRYADAIVIGNSVAIQGHLGAWTSVEVASVSVTSPSGVYETIEDPEWAAPFTYDGIRWSYLPQVLSGRVNIDKDNITDAATITLDNWGLADPDHTPERLYSAMHFINRRSMIVARAGDGNGRWTDWTVLLRGTCSEKTITAQDGRAILDLPMRDEQQAKADDQEVMGCYSDATDAIQGVTMNYTLGEVISDLYTVKAGLAAGDVSVLATPNNTPRSYNVFRQSCQQAVRTLAEHGALAVYQKPSSGGQIQVAEWPWGSGSPGYEMSTAEEIIIVSWTASAFDLVARKQLSFQNTEWAGANFDCAWPPHKAPWFGRQENDSAVVSKDSTEHAARPVTALQWWAANRKIGSIDVTAMAQLWVDHDLELKIKDSRYIGLGGDTEYIVDGWEHTWDGDGPIETRIRLIDRNFWRQIRRAVR